MKINFSVMFNNNEIMIHYIKCEYGMSSDISPSLGLKFSSLDNSIDVCNLNSDFISLLF